MTKILILSIKAHFQNHLDVFLRLAAKLTYSAHSAFFEMMGPNQLCCLAGESHVFQIRRFQWIYEYITFLSSSTLEDITGFTFKPLGCLMHWTLIYWYIQRLICIINQKLVTRADPAWKGVTRSNLGEGKVEPQLFCFFRRFPPSAAHLPAHSDPAQKSHSSALLDTFNQTVMEMLMIKMILLIVILIYCFCLRQRIIVKLQRWGLQTKRLS